MKLPPLRPPDDPRVTPIWLRKDLLAAGLDDRAIARAIADGSLHRVRYGAYADGADWRACDPPGRHGLTVRAVVRRATAQLVASHESAEAEWEIPIWDQALDQVHVTFMDERGGRREAGVCRHQGTLREEDWVERNGLLVTSPTRTALDCACVLDVEHGITIVGDLLHRRLTTPAQLAAGAAFMEHWPGSLKHNIVLQIADGRCESVGEHRMLYLIWKAGLPKPIPQYEIRDPATGRVVAVVDFAWPELGVFLEFDGLVKYQRLLREGETASDAVIREKQREDMICQITDWRCVRVVWAELYRQAATGQKIRSTLFRSRRAA